MQFIGPNVIPIRQASTCTADDKSYSVASFVISFCVRFVAPHLNVNLCSVYI